MHENFTTDYVVGLDGRPQPHPTPVFRISGLAETDARQSLHDHQNSPHRPTEWTKQNIYRRQKSFRKAHWAGSNAPLPPTLYLETEHRLAREDVERNHDIRERIRHIKHERKRIAKMASGMTKSSTQRRVLERQQSEAHRRERQAEIDDFDKSVGSNSIAYHICFQKFDMDGSGSIDVDELKMVLRHMGIQVSDKKVVNLLERYDEDKNGTLNFEEFCKFAREVQMDPDAKSLILAKDQLMRATRPRGMSDDDTLSTKSSLTGHK